MVKAEKTTRKKLKQIKAIAKAAELKKIAKKNKNTDVSSKTNNQSEDVSGKNAKSTSKVVKRMKYTMTKLNIDEAKLAETLKGIKEYNMKLNEKLEESIYTNIYVYVVFNNPIDGALKNKIFKLAYPIMNSINKLKILLVSDNVDFEGLFKDEETLTSIGGFVEIMNEESFSQMVSTTKFKSNLNYLYRMIISDNKFNFKLQKLLTKKVYRKFDTLNLNIGTKEKSKKFLLNVIKSACNGGLMKKLSNTVFSMKAANCSMPLTEIFKNIKLQIYKIVAEVLEKGDKHNNVKSIVLKTDNSQPFPIYNDLTTEEYELFKKDQ